MSDVQLPSSTPPDSSSGTPASRPRSASGGATHILLIDDETDARQTMGSLLERDGYRVSFAENGREALTSLFEGSRPDVIVLDLKMPVMNGWEFRRVQRHEAAFGIIPVLAISGDGSAQAEVISAHAYLRKPFGAEQLLSTIERVLIESESEKATSVSASASERLGALSRLAAGVGHHINNPLATVMMNLDHALERLDALTSATSALGLAPVTPGVEAGVRYVSEVLRECQAGSERIRGIVSLLQRLTQQQSESHHVRLDVHAIILQAVSLLCERGLPRARLTKNFGLVPTIRGDAEALTRVFLNLLLNAAESIAEADAERHEIRVSSWVEAAEYGGGVVVEVADSGTGIAPEIAPYLFDPFFTTKLLGRSVGLGLTTSQHTLLTHGGRITFESELGKGSAFRVFLPAALSALPPHTDPGHAPSP